MYISLILVNEICLLLLPKKYKNLFSLATITIKGQAAARNSINPVADLYRWHWGGGGTERSFYYCEAWQRKLMVWIYGYMNQEILLIG